MIRVTHAFAQNTWSRMVRIHADRYGRRINNTQSSSKIKLALLVVKVRQILCSDWPHNLSRSGLPALILRKKKKMSGAD